VVSRAEAVEDAGQYGLDLLRGHLLGGAQLGCEIDGGLLGNSRL
jgi:hypothetical protein